MTPPIVALTVRQPWADAILYAGKRIENRTWRCSRTGPVLLHSAATADEVEDAPTDLPGVLGAFLGVVRVVGCHRAEDGEPCSPWADPDCWHWELTDVQRLSTPVPCKGRLGLWVPPREVLHQVRDAGGCW